MSTEQVYAPGILVPLTFDPTADLLGSGTVGEVFKVTLHKCEISTIAADNHDELVHFALKRFFNRDERDDFANERDILEALSALPHAHIVSCLSSWTSQNASYMLFPLANGDLYRFLRDTAPPKLTKRFAVWLLEQIGGLCDAVKYLHDYELPCTSSSEEASTMRRIGFHHDLKPANILLYGADANNAIWKIGDFGSGTVKYVSSSSRDSIYNRKASTGDPIYSAPEYIVEGKVSRPKDIWSLGCIFLEVLIWALDPSSDAINRFELARRDFSKDSSVKSPTYWYQGRDGLPYLNSAVVLELDFVDARCKETGFFIPVLETIRQMLTISPKCRPVAAQLCEQFQGMLKQIQSYPDDPHGASAEKLC